MRLPASLTSRLVLTAVSLVATTRSTSVATSRPVSELGTSLRMLSPPA